MARKSAAAVAEEVQDTAAEQIEGQVDALVASDGWSTPTDQTPEDFSQVPDDPESQGPVEPADEPVPFGGTEYAGMSEKEVRSKLYSKAQTAIINRHRDEFNKLCDELFTPLGLVFARKKTPKEKAADQIRALLAEHPELKPEFPGLALEAKVEGTPEDAVIR